MSYELTRKGEDAVSRMWKMYHHELAERQKADPDFVDGWGIIDNKRYIKTIDDEVDVLMGAYGNDVLNVLSDWVDPSNIDDKCCADWSVKEVISRISERGLLEVTK